jgi:serine/threonine-protein kinase
MNACPSRDQFRLLLAEQLDDAERHGIEDHVEACAACQRLLAELTDSLPQRAAPEGDTERHPGPGSAFLRRLKQAPPPEPAGRAREDENRTTPPPGTAATLAAAESWPPVPGYEVLGVLGRGGMGVVYRAGDPAFGRTLAVKVLRDRLRGDAAAAHRFLDEARLCGQLQHPGVPSVHELGTLADGRPFFAMKLVQGDTLAALLALRAGPAEELPRFLAIFEQVCQTVAYAHSKGVIHRDLKPANVMVGAFGEVQVMDWGLAKVLAEPGARAATAAAEASTLYAARGPGSPEETAPGSILGTLAFMPPEQANGRITEIDERADVFALGAILCVILTGRPPDDDAAGPGQRRSGGCGRRRAATAPGGGSAAVSGSVAGRAGQVAGAAGASTAGGGGRLLPRRPGGTPAAGRRPGPGAG